MSHYRRSTSSTYAARLLETVTRREHALLTGRGAAGIVAALQALGLQSGLVGIPANTCYVVLWAVLRAGCQPVLLDVDATTGNLPATPETHGAVLKAIIPCHLYGLPTPMPTICAWAQANDIVVIEDAALALGAQVDDRPAGGWGDASIFSFGIGKILDHGNGGAVLTDDARLAAEMARVLGAMPLWDDRLLDLTQQWNAVYWALHQFEERNPHLNTLYPMLYDLYGELTSYRLPDADWRGLAEALDRMQADKTQRLERAALYDAHLRGLPVETLARSEGATLWKYPLLVAADARDDLLAALWEVGVHEATRWYPSLQAMTAALCPDLSQPPTPNTDALAARIINLPLDVTEAQVARIANVIEDNRN